MNNIIHSLTEVNRKNFFNIKKTIVKVVKATSAVDFNKNCIRENLSPKSLYGQYTGNKNNITNTLINRQQEAEKRLQTAKDEQTRLWSSFALDQEYVRQPIQEYIKEYEDHQFWIANTKLQKKLTALHKGPVRNERPAKGYINLSTTTLTKHQEQLLNLGLKCTMLKNLHLKANASKLNAL